MANSNATAPELIDLDLYPFIVPPAANYVATLVLIHGHAKETAEEREEAIINRASEIYTELGGAVLQPPLTGSYSVEDIEERAYENNGIVFGAEDQIKWLATRYLAGDGDDYETFTIRY